MFTRKPRLQLEKFAINGAKRLLQHNLPIGDITIQSLDHLVGAVSSRSRIARCEVRYNREKVLLVEIGYNLGHQRAPFSRSGAVLEVIELSEHVAR